jgi:hypothetical protein
LALESPNNIYIWYVGSLSNITCSSVVKSFILQNNWFVFCKYVY